MYLRIESSDPKRRTVRCGMKAAEGDDWTWSRALKFRRPILFLDNIHLMNFDARHEGLTAKLKSPPPLYSRLVDEERLGKTLKPAGKEVTVSFDYARFEGKVVSRKEGVDYVRTEIPEVETVFPEGEHYEAVVPDTFDIEERSGLAVHGLTCLTDPNADFEIHWWGDFTRRAAGVASRLERHGPAQVHGSAAVAAGRQRAARRIGTSSSDGVKLPCTCRVPTVCCTTRSSAVPGTSIPSGKGWRTGRNMWRLMAWKAACWAP